MKWRKISLAEVRTVITQPDTIERYPLDRTLINATKTIGSRRLLVAYKREGNKLVIVTAVDKND